MYLIILFKIVGFIIFFLSFLYADDIANLNIKQQTDQNIERQRRSMEQVTPFTGGSQINIFR